MNKNNNQNLNKEKKMNIDDKGSRKMLQTFPKLISTIHFQSTDEHSINLNNNSEKTFETSFYNTNMNLLFFQKKEINGFVGKKISFEVK